MNEKMRLWVAGTVVIILVLVYFGTRSSNSGKTTGDDLTPAASSTISEGGAASSTASSTPSSTTGGGTASTLTYTQAVNKYKNQRIQFDQVCTMIPNPISIRNNTVLMLDNRAPFAQTIYLDRVAYRIGGYSFKLVTVKKSPLPHTTVVDCGTGRNTGKIIVQ